MKKYNKIVSAFTKTIKKLENLKTECVNNAASHYEKISNLEGERMNMISEGDQAQVTADKLKGIFGE